MKRLIIILLLLLSFPAFSFADEAEDDDENERELGGYIVGGHRDLEQNDGEEELSLADYGNPGTMDAGLNVGAGTIPGYSGAATFFSPSLNYFFARNFHAGITLMALVADDPLLLYIYPNIGYLIPVHDKFKIDISYYLGGFIYNKGPNGFSSAMSVFFKFPLFNKVIFSVGCLGNVILSGGYEDRWSYIFTLSLSYYWF